MNQFVMIVTTETIHGSTTNYHNLTDSNFVEGMLLFNNADSSQLQAFYNMQPKESKQIVIERQGVTKRYFLTKLF